MQNPEGTMTQKQRTHKKEREHSTSRPTEETQATVLPATTRHSTLILPSTPLDEQPPKKGLLPFSAFGSSREPRWRPCSREDLRGEVHSVHPALVSKLQEELIETHAWEHGVERDP